DAILPDVRSGGRISRGTARDRPLHARRLLGLHEVRPALGGRGPASGGGPRVGSRAVKVAFFGAFDPEYPRNVVLEEGLRAHGVETTRIAVAPKTPLGLREAKLMGRWAAGARALDAILVPAFGHRDVPLAAALGRASGVPVLFDPLVSRWDTQVADWARA